MQSRPNLDCQMCYARRGESLGDQWEEREGDETGDKGSVPPLAEPLSRLCLRKATGTGKLILLPLRPLTEPLLLAPSTCSSAGKPIGRPRGYPPPAETRDEVLSPALRGTGENTTLSVILAVSSSGAIPRSRRGRSTVFGPGMIGPCRVSVVVVVVTVPPAVSAGAEKVKLFRSGDGAGRSIITSVSQLVPYPTRYQVIGDARIRIVFTIACNRPTSSNTRSVSVIVRLPLSAWLWSSEISQLTPRYAFPSYPCPLPSARRPW